MLNRSVPPAVQPFHYQGFPEVLSHRLTNGMEVYLINMGKVPVMNLQLKMRTGYCYELQKGVSQATFKLLTDGTQNYTSFELAAALEALGASISYDVGYEQSGLSMSCTTERFADALTLFEEAYLKPTFPKEEFENFQQRWIRNISVEEQKTRTWARRLFMEKIFGADHPYGQSIYATHVDKLNLENIRQFYETQLFKNDNYCIVSGQFDEHKVLAELENRLGKISLRPSSDISRSKQIKPTSSLGRHVHLMDKQVQSTVLIGHLGITRNHPDYEEVRILGTLLGGFFGSRLMQNIREDKGYTYGIFASFVGMKEAGYFIVSTDVANEYVKETLSEIHKEIHRLQNEPVSSEELQMVKNYLLGELVSEMETPFHIADIFTTLKLHGQGTDAVQKMFFTIENITPERIQALAQQYFHPNSVEIIAGSSPISSI